MKRSGGKQTTLAQFIKPKTNVPEVSPHLPTEPPAAKQMRIDTIRNNSSSDNDSHVTKLEVLTNSDIIKVNNSEIVQSNRVIDSDTKDCYKWDVGLYVGKVQLDDFIREMLLKSPWIPSPTYKFPVSEKRNLKFQTTWFKNHPWLVYSDALQGALCKYCIIFALNEAGKGSHQTLGLLVTKAYTNWKNALEDFREHSTNLYHKRCVEAAENFTMYIDGKRKDIADLVNSENEWKKAENRVVLQSIVKTVMLCGVQEIALRGKYDSGNVMENCDSNNDGNFRALLRFRAEAGDTALKKHLESGAKNAQYVSPRSQNEFIELSGKLIQENIVQKINESSCFAVLADETTDTSGIEQMSLCARYVEKSENRIREDFLKFVPAEDLTGKRLATLIINNLKEIGIECKNLTGQGYDGAAAMSGHLNGAQAIIRQQFPMALYAHCGAHSLNLALADSCSLPAIRNYCIGTVQAVGNFFRKSGKNKVHLKNAIRQELPNSRHTVLLDMCETRWVYKHEAIIRFKEIMPALIEALTTLESHVNRDVSQKAHQLLLAISQCQFIVSLVVLEKVFCYSLELSKSLQSVKYDLVGALSHVDDIIGALSEVRSNADKEFTAIFEDATALVKKAGEEIKIPRLPSKSMKRENVPCSTPEEYYKRSIFVPFLDHVITQLTERLKKHKALISSLLYLLPKYCQDINTENLEVLLTFYGDLLPEKTTLQAEIFMWKRKWQKENKKPVTAIATYVECHEEFFPNIKKLLQVLATLPVSTATPERSFSMLKRLKTYLRNTTSEKRLTGLALLSVYREMHPKPEDVVARFMKEPRRI